MRWLILLTIQFCIHLSFPPFVISKFSLFSLKFYFIASSILFIISSPFLLSTMANKFWTPFSLLLEIATIFCFLLQLPQLPNQELAYVCTHTSLVRKNRRGDIFRSFQNTRLRISPFISPIISISIYSTYITQSDYGIFVLL